MIIAISDFIDDLHPNELCLSLLVFADLFVSLYLNHNLKQVQLHICHVDASSKRGIDSIRSHGGIHSELVATPLPGLFPLLKVITDANFNTF